MKTIAIDHLPIEKNPIYSNDFNSAYIYSNIMLPLFKHNGKVVRKNACKNFKIIGNKYIIEIYDNIKYNNGQQVNINDYYTTFKNILNKKCYAKYLLENVKKIVNAIKSLKIKYYLDFSKISEEDEMRFKQLESNLDKISEENNLDGLKTELMSEVVAKYEKRDIKEGSPRFIDDKLMACYGAIDVQQKVLSEGKIKKAIKCQQLLDKYINELDSMTYKDLIVNYKREKFGELIRSKEAVHENNEQWSTRLQDFCINCSASARKEATEQIENAKENTISLFSKGNT